MKPKINPAEISNGNEYPFHPVAEIFAMLDDAALDELAQDIKTHGQRVPIELVDGQVIDGRNRYVACRIAGVDPRFVELESTPTDLVSYVLSRNLHRRHLDRSQRAMAAA